ncbi:ATP-binding cassette domain-containing protein [Bifidobacterium reuteri]|uniref:ATP-binding cassette domain-containing protein n=1 Tax=Bifidobacterium reuteri TaxID=983706 RepID=A0A5J5E8Y7_9BIFI|nr:polysaccharide ABC transporter ATP-binding protein [Bifidobacterium reuteri]KAA8825491.1 ATP-binding cassette domain-containing protein [Bifidobacterium reuteri]
MVDQDNMASSATSNNESPVVLSVKHVAKSFRLPTEQASGLKQAFLNWTKGIKGYREQQVLRDINFDVHQGDFFGIVGRNGSGKSTLLKIISGIYKPEQGSVSIHGKLVPFIELGVGFNPELTGRENVYLNGALLGFSHDEIDTMYDDIVAFAELEEFMDQKLKNYSSGMQVRLAFSVAIKAQADILVLDEVLAVGDEAFQRKCDTFFKEMQQNPSKTVILVTHDMSSVKKYCNKAILIRDGEIVVSGDKDQVAGQYTLDNLKSTADKDVNTGYPVGLNETIPSVKVTPISPLEAKHGKPFRFDVEYECTEDIDHYVVATLYDLTRGGITYDTGSLTHPQQGAGKRTLHFEMPIDMLNSGTYRLYANIRVEDKEHPGQTQMIAFTNAENCCVFTIDDPEHESYALLNEIAMNMDLLSIDKSK